ncbi:hypothetical protein [Brevundimonas diminuta]|uniref:hypothetical protein n=1 Tax=Brevundimonas diminuta TaxID=293 RepID=UPI003209D637
MTDDIERMLATPFPDAEAAPLAGLEEQVWRRIDARMEQRRARQVRLAVMAVALLVGVTNGGLWGQAFKPERSDIQVFSVSAGLSPMTRFEVGG